MTFESRETEGGTIFAPKSVVNYIIKGLKTSIRAPNANFPLGEILYSTPSLQVGQKPPNSNLCGLINDLSFF